MAEKRTLKRQECLKSRKTIKALFAENNYIKHPPLKLFWSIEENTQKPKIEVAFAVPKKNFKLAVDRNKIKRQLREAYRLDKHIILKKTKSKNITLSLIFVFTNKTKVKYAEIKNAINCIHHRLSDDI